MFSGISQLAESTSVCCMDPRECPLSGCPSLPSGSCCLVRAPESVPCSGACFSVTWVYDIIMSITVAVLCRVVPCRAAGAGRTSAFTTAGGQAGRPAGGGTPLQYQPRCQSHARASKSADYVGRHHPDWSAVYLPARAPGTVRGWGRPRTAASSCRAV